VGGKQLRLWAGLQRSKKHRVPEEGDVETGRGKKGKNAAWHLNLGVKDVIFAGIGIVGLMMISFALGALAGRGDIYRAAYSWGLMSPEPKTVAQIIPQTAQAPTPPAAEAPPPASLAVATVQPAAAPPATAPAASTAASAKPPHPAPVAGSIAPIPPPASAASTKKKAKSAQAQHEQKARDEQLRQHQDVAKKLTFLNSFDSTPKPRHKKDTKAAAAKPQPAQVKVATYRDSKAAQAKMAELQKKGVKVSLKQGKDAKGASYTVYRQAPAAPKETEKLAQSKEKPAASDSRKPKSE
jgi:hypothetical protein